MTDEHDTFYCSFVSIDYIICECGETFPSEDDLRVHLEKEHPHKKERKEYKCGICEKIYPTEQECIDHYEHAHIEIKLEHNYGVDPDTLDEYNEEVKEDFLDPDLVEATYEVKTEPLELVFGILKFGKRLSAVKKGPPGCRPHPKNIVCEVCGKKYASNAALRYHQRVHTGERPYKCTMCDKTFTMPLFLKIHVRTHTGERPYKCTACPKAFSNKAALLRHDRSWSGQSNSMKLHVHTVHLKMPAPYKSKRRRLKEKGMQVMTGRQEIKLLSGLKMQDIKLMSGMKMPDVKSGVQKVFVKEEEVETSQPEVTYLCEDDENVTYSLVYE
ncbi:hypothetical protein K1T71_000822 [Dendrolimus kikuchii]|uniref:Uncharacterized protein n=1 Tax=Dendrolimus kikuchii TaxID=765133 RepID=A0ACC1DK86_9NEOP|nr:hypothetical protein K1T71_000822 [Dendrolimus kikuchii]